MKYPYIYSPHFIKMHPEEMHPPQREKPYKFSSHCLSNFKWWPNSPPQIRYCMRMIAVAATFLSLNWQHYRLFQSTVVNRKKPIGASVTLSINHQTCPVLLLATMWTNPPHIMMVIVTQPTFVLFAGLPELFILNFPLSQLDSFHVIIGKFWGW